MSLIELWRSSRAQLLDKRIQQVIAFAGEGRLTDGSAAATELREYLDHVSSDLLEQFVNDCLQESFTDSGFALQDVVNQIGSRLGFEVTHGRYRGKHGETGEDGVWRMPDGHAVIIEVKTTDAYRIDLEKLAAYRKALIASGRVPEDKSSGLIIVGRQDTGDLEAQIRGSRHAWDVRVISVGALLRMMHLREAAEDPQTVSRIRAVLVPREFTRLDAIVDIVFSVAEEVQQEEEESTPEPTGDAEAKSGSKFHPVSFHEGCAPRLEAHLKTTLVKRSRSTYASPDGAVRLTCSVSKVHDFAGDEAYWFAYHPHYLEFLDGATSGYGAFGCGSADTLFLFPITDLRGWLNDAYRTERDDRMYWHVQLYREGKHWFFKRRQGSGNVEVTKYLLARPMK